MRAAPLLALALWLAGCGGEEGPLNEGEAAQSIENIATAAPVKEPDHRPVLEPLNEAEVAAELNPGARCAFSVGERLAFVAVSGDSIAKVNGRLIHFTTAGPLGPTGGYFVGGGYTLSIGRTEKAARIAVSDHSRVERPVREHRGTWRCGA